MVRDFSRGKIYQIISPSTGLIYVGSTTQPTLAHRLAQHKRDYYQYWRDRSGKKCSSYIVLREWDYRIELLELYPCNSQDELYAREGYYQRTLSCVNKLKNNPEKAPTKRILCECGREISIMTKGHKITRQHDKALESLANKK